MALPNTSVPKTIPTTGAGENLQSGFNDVMTNFGAALANDVYQENEIAVNTQAISAILARLGGMVGGYVAPTSNFTYSQASALWNTATVISTINGAASSATLAPLAVFMCGQTTSGGLPILVVVSGNGGNLVYTTFSVSASGALVQLATSQYASTGYLAIEVTGVGTFRLHNKANNTCYDLTISTTGAITSASLAATAYLDGGNPAESRSISQSGMASQVGNSSVVIFGYIGASEYVPYAVAQARATVGNPITSAMRDGIRADSFQNGAGANPIGWTNLGGGFFLQAGIGKRAAESYRLNFYLWFADDNGMQRLGAFSFNSLPTAVQVSALSNSLVLVKFQTSSGYYMIPLAVNVGSKTFNFAMNAQNQSNQYVGTGGFGLPMADTVAYNATSGVMVTKEGSGSTNPNVFAFRPFTFDTTQAANPALAETASPITFSFGQGVDTTGTAYIQFVYRFSSDIVILVGGGGSGGGTASALVVQSMSLTKQ